jgi:hypothetical protein
VVRSQHKREEAELAASKKALAISIGDSELQSKWDGIDFRILTCMQDLLASRMKLQNGVTKFE